MADETSKEKYEINFQTNADKARKDVEGLNASIDQTTESVNANSKAVDKQDEQYKSLKTQLREANQELVRQIQLYGETSAQAVNAARGVASLNDQIGFARDLSEQFNPDQNFKALGAATQVATTGIQGVTAGMALFGDQSEDTEKMLLKVQSAMAFSDAISGLSNLSDQWVVLKTVVQSSSIATKANAAATVLAAGATKLFGGSVNLTSTSFKVLKGAIAATGIGLLVVGVVALIQNFEKVKEVLFNLVPGLAQVGEFIGGIVEAVTDFVGVTSEGERALDKLTEAADESLKKNKRFLDEHGDQVDEYTKQKIDAVNRYNEAIKEDATRQVQLAARLNRELAKADADRAESIAKARQEAEEKEKKRLDEEAKKKADAEKKANEAQLKVKVDIKKAEIKNEEDLLAVENSILEGDLQYKKELKEQNEKETAESIEQIKTEMGDAAHANLVARIDRDLQEEERVLQAKKDNQQRIVDLGEQLISNVTKLAGKNKAIQKATIIADGAIGVGKAISNTAEAVTKDLAKGAPFSAPLVALDLAVGATSVASIIQGTSKALQAVGGGSAPSAPSLPSAPSGINAAPQTGFQASSENQIATSVAGAQQSQPPVRAFVVGSEVTTQQGLDANLIQENSFGG
jgi:hypothetical protein